VSTSATESALELTNQHIDAFSQQLAELDQQLGDLQNQRTLVVSELESAKALRQTLTASLEQS
jgi:hypothetical protein